MLSLLLLIVIVIAVIYSVSSCIIRLLFQNHILISMSTWRLQLKCVNNTLKILEAISWNFSAKYPNTLWSISRNLLHFFVGKQCVAGFLESILK